MALILVVEDEPLIAMLLEDWICELGHEVAASAGSLEAGMKLASELKFDAAIIDLNLRSHRSDPIAEILKSRAIPFAVATGSAQECVAGAFAGVPAVSKPFTYEDVEQGIATLMKALRRQDKPKIALA